VAERKKSGAFPAGRSGAREDYELWQHEISDERKNEMSGQEVKQKVKIVRLGSMRVASVHGYGSEPETQAMEKLRAWAKPKGFFERPEEHRIFGFNNPSPSPGSPNYGYEFWMVVGPEVEAEEGVEIKDFSGGLYAVTRWDGKGDPYKTIPAAWERLVLWRENSRYRSAGHQWLEEHIEPDESEDVEFKLDLYLPIAE
jgi:AraC family transcriptional regulator